MKLTSGLIILTLVLAALIAGCAETITTGAVVCNKPYILVGNSCCLDANDNSICDKDETQTPTDNKPTPKPEPETPEQTQFKLTKGDSLQVFGKTFTLVDFSVMQGKIETLVDVDGTRRELYETKKTEIVNGLRITPQSVDRLQTYIIINIEPLKLQQDEYLLNVNEDNLILGKVIRLRDVQDDNGVLVEIVDSGNVFVMPGDTKKADSLEITNVESFYRTTKIERYAIVKITA